MRSLGLGLQSAPLPLKPVKLQRCKAGAPGGPVARAYVASGAHAQLTRLEAGLFPLLARFRADLLRHPGLRRLPHRPAHGGASARADAASLGVCAFPQGQVRQTMGLSPGRGRRPLPR